MSPYVTTVDAIAAQFATSAERKDIMRGFLQFRQDLRAIGIVTGWQWLDGSFLEDVEKLESRAPRDLDVVTFCWRAAVPDWQVFVQQHLHLFDPNQTRHRYHCDAYFVELGLGPYTVVNQARYWFGLFSHQRKTAVWKGMLEVTLDGSSDAAATALVDT